MKRPNYFIVGAPKCGTTAMHAYLAQHPEVFMARRKEAHFFGSDLRVRFGRPGEAEYLSYFEPVKDEKAIGEASVFYLYSQRAAEEIRAFCPEAKIIIMLRDPVEMMHSLHAYKLSLATENLRDFAEALAAEPRRKEGLDVPRSAQIVESHLYRELAHFSAQVQRMFDAFGRANVHVILFDDFKADLAETYRKVLAFLGVDASFAPEFEVSNPTVQIRSRSFQRLAGALARSRHVQRLTPGFLRSAVRRLNTAKVGRSPMDPALARALREELTPDVQRLAQLLGRDLTPWCVPASAGAAAGSGSTGPAGQKA